MKPAPYRLPDANGLMLLAVDNLDETMAYYQTLGYTELVRDAGSAYILPSDESLPAIQLTTRSLKSMIDRLPRPSFARTCVAQQLPLPAGTATILRYRLKRELYQNDHDQPIIALDLRKRGRS